MSKMNLNEPTTLAAVMNYRYHIMACELNANLKEYRERYGSKYQDFEYLFQAHCAKKIENYSLMRDISNISCEYDVSRYKVSAELDKQLGHVPKYENFIETMNEIKKELLICKENEYNKQVGNLIKSLELSL
jgi:hypothetical protein